MLLFWFLLFHRLLYLSLINYSAQIGSESRFRDSCFFSVEQCYILWSVLLHHWFCIAPLLEYKCTIGVVLRHYFSILFAFQVIRKGSEGSNAESLCDSDGNSNVKCGEVFSGKRCVA